MGLLAAAQQNSDVWNTLILYTIPTCLGIIATWWTVKEGIEKIISVRKDHNREFIEAIIVAKNIKLERKVEDLDKEIHILKEKSVTDKQYIVDMFAKFYK